MFDRIIDDIEFLIEKRLASIRPGAEIIIKKVDREQGRIVLVTASGKNQSRPFGEIKNLWEQLNEYPAIRVDEALHGSGTSRNQPETILANLPYIEWFKYNNKKHIAYVGKDSHMLGTLKQMDEERAEQYRARLRGEADNSDTVSTIVVTDDVLKATKAFEHLAGISVHTVHNGIYSALVRGREILFVTNLSIGNALPIGTYYVIKRPVGNVSQQVVINGTKYGVIQCNGFNALVNCK